MTNRKLLLAVAAILASCITSTYAKYTYNNTKKYVEEIIEAIAKKENINEYKIPRSLSREYKQIVKDISQTIDTFIEKLSSISLEEDLEDAMNKAINKRLRKYNLYQSDIPSSLQSKFKNIKKSILRKLKDKLWYHNGEYITQDELTNVVESKLTYSFIQKIKNNNSSDFSWVDTIGTVITSVASAISSSNTSSSSSNYSSSSSQSTPSKPEKTFYSDNCTICLCDFYGEERVGVLDCGHVFHPECIKQWLKNSKTCPLCRHKDAYVAKIYDSKERVPGYTPKETTYIEPSAPAFEDSIYPEPSAPDFEDSFYEHVDLIHPEPSAPELDTSSHIYYEEECPICLENLETRIGVLSCGHTFHVNCINDWFNNGTTKICPMCNKEGVILAKIYNHKTDLIK